MRTGAPSASTAASRLQSDSVEKIFRWRRIDEEVGLELLRLTMGDNEIHVRSRLLVTGPESYGVDFDWHLDPAWRTRRIFIRLTESHERTVLIERAAAAAWRVNNHPRPDLDGCHEVDLSPTPFCNTLAIRRLFHDNSGSAGEMTAVYVNFPAMTIQPSRQRYERRGERQFQFIDLGANKGFEALLTVDDEGMVEKYDGLFELVVD
jgi:uncharacterized protein